MPLPPRVRRIARQLVRERVYLTLRDWILDGTLRPNEILRDVELAARLGVSRTPVREALRRLEDEGFVQTAANRWTRVAPANLEDALRIYPMIWTLEALAMRDAGPRLTASDLEEMTRANNHLNHALKEKDAVKASTADRTFHGVFVRRTANPELIHVIEWLKMKLRRIEVVYFGGSLVAEASVREHQQILQALRVKDIEAAAQGVELNWRRSLERLIRYTEEIPQVSKEERV
jgi:DNA-binding GntR family transcriptional regulator